MRSTVYLALRVGELWLVAVSLGLFIRVLSRAEHESYLIEAAVFLAVLLLLVSLRPIRSLVLSLPAIHRSIVIAFVGFALMAQVASRVYYTFPFAAWTMYSEPPQPPHVASHYEFIGVTRDGRRIRVGPGEAIPGHMRMYVKLSRLLAKALAPDAPEDDRERLTQALAGMGKAHNHQHRDDPIRELEVRQCRLDPWKYSERAQAGSAPPWDESLLERETIWRIPIESPPSTPPEGAEPLPR